MAGMKIPHPIRSRPRIREAMLCCPDFGDLKNKSITATVIAMVGILILLVIRYVFSSEGRCNIYTRNQAEMEELG